MLQILTVFDCYSQSTGTFQPLKSISANTHIYNSEWNTVSNLEDTGNANNLNLLPVHAPQENAIFDSTLSILQVQQKIRYSQLHPINAPVYKNQPDPPSVNKVFIAQPASPQYTPNDNSLAVSNDGYIISCINSSYYIFDTSGTNLKKGNFSTLVGTSSLPPGGFFYDPRVLFDPGLSRFIMVVLYGQSPEISRVVVCISNTGNPTGTWNVYILNGGFGNNLLWMDYPQAAVSKSELFVTGNMFDGSGKFSESIILQINKNDLASGNPINYKQWSSIDGNPFSLCPSPASQQNQMNEGMRFICNEAMGGNKIYIYQITNAKDLQPQMVQSTITVSPYKKTSPALQKGTSDILDQGDCRFRSAYIKDGLIHGVFSKSTVNNFSGIYYIRVDMDNYIYRENEMYADGLDYAYPSIAPASNQTNNRLTYINLLVSGADRFPQSQGALCDQEMTFSEPILIKAGENFVNTLSSTTERWGDYTCMTKTYETDIVNIWGAGSYGAFSNRLGNIVSHYILKTDSVYSFATEQKVEIFPIPASNELNINFQFPVSVSVWLDIVPMDGSNFSKSEIIDELRSFNNIYTYNIKQFSPGIYIFIIRNNDGIIYRQKVIIIPQ